MVVDTTINSDEKVCGELQEIKPDCIVSDSVCFWGKLFAAKLNIKCVCSTTTFAFNLHTARMMKRGVGEFIRTIIGMPRINKKMKLLKANGYEVKNFVSIIQNDNDTNTIVYTSKKFQPMAETFSDKYAFVGPSVTDVETEEVRHERRTVYISLGTVLNKNNSFYENCIKALKECDVDVIMSVEEKTDILALGEVPSNFDVEDKADVILMVIDSDEKGIDFNIRYFAPENEVEIAGHHTVAAFIALAKEGALGSIIKNKHLIKTNDGIVIAMHYRTKALGIPGYLFLTRLINLFRFQD